MIHQQNIYGNDMVEQAIQRMRTFEPEEDHWLGGSGKQFSDNVLVSIYNSDDEDEWVDVSQTIDGRWALELPAHCEITAWRELPEPYREEE